MQKIWNVKQYDETYINSICERYKISKALAKLLVARDINYDDIDIFLNGNLDDLKDPYLIKDMDKFVERVDKAINAHEKICIYGDYDVDGVTSITVIYKFLKALNADIDYYLPDRLEEGYGLNIEALKGIKASGTSLVITVDCGITAIEEVEYANSIGLDICITDHHECSDNLPNACAIVNTKRKDDEFSFKMHAGVGIAFKCITALAIKYNLPKGSYLKYLDIVAVGTISDIVSLVDENRIIAKYGLNQLQNTSNKGLTSLFKIAGIKEIDSISISFAIAPRINACGRMGNASIAVKLLLAEDDDEAYRIANVLELQNRQRQMIEKEIFEEAVNIIQKNDLASKNSIVLMSKNWHHGVIGIVASRLVSMYAKPVILLTMEEGIARGSGRCQVGFSLYDAISKCSNLVVQFGGHELAAGLTIETSKFEEFRDKFEAIVEETTGGKIAQVTEVDDIITKMDLNSNLIKDISILKPNGQGNKVPIFLYSNLRVNSIRTIKDDKHLKLNLWDSGNLIDAIAFSKGNRRDELRLGDRIDILCSVAVNEYLRPKTIQLIVQDFKRCVE